MTHGAHRGAYRGRFKDAKKATFHDQVCVFFYYFKEQTTLLCGSKVKRALVHDHFSTVVTRVMAATSSVPPLHTIWQL